MEELESIELAEPETTESEDVVEVADEGPPEEPEDLARRLFASYLETADAEPEEEESPEAESEAPQDLPVDADDWHVLGSPDAPVTMIEYSDFQ